MRSPLIFRIFKNNEIFVVKQFIDTDRVIIGHGGDVHIDLPSPEISPIHCLIERRSDLYFLCDLGSQIGTIKKNKAVLDEQINSGESFTVGPFKIEFAVGQQKSNQGVSHRIYKDEVVFGQKRQQVLKENVNSINNKAEKKETTSFTKRSKVEVIVSWQDRIVNTYQIAPVGTILLGNGKDIDIPDGMAPKNWQLINFYNGTFINISNEMSAEIIKNGESVTLKNSQHNLLEDEVCFIKLVNGMNISIRLSTQKTAPILLESPFVLGSSEMAGILIALIFAVMTSIIIAISKPKAIKSEESVMRVAQIVFNSSSQSKINIEDTVPKIEPAELEKKAELKKALLLDQKKESQAYGAPQKPNQVLQKEQKAGRAAEVKPKNEKLKTKFFTSTKQGGAVKTGDVNGANAKSKEIDLANSGLLAAFGEGGSREKLDQVYSGLGEAIGAAEKATGTSGFNSNRNGNDLGSNIKDTGAGGFGTATVGISGVGTKGRSTGMSGYGSGAGFGDKDRVQISAGGLEENFIGSIDREAVRRVVKSALPQLKACYEREYRQNTRLEGKLVLTWEIHQRGVAKNAIVVKEKSTINNVIVEECVRTRLLSLIFPEPPVGTVAEVTFPFIFQGQKL